MPSKTHVQQCAALICAYISADDEGCDALRKTLALTNRQWYESATILCAAVLDLIAFHLDSHPHDVIGQSGQSRRDVFPGPRQLLEAQNVVVYYDLHRQVPARESTDADLVPSLFDIAVTAIEQLAQLWRRPAVEVARLLTLGAATYEGKVW
ncbi:hypothetical protein FEZ60_19255 [Rhodococcus sp. MS16]|uniref:hypothetical protein n=1 Tax=Rhodococcus sp. MS16 TaxID=2579941 RepID=UPI001562A45F|nr:hypothetical protein [Rhodococcus sp. MS16]NRI67664.1 hypothetical protein [Rhodococcus sp. MS16]